LGGKCEDLSALYAGLARAAGLPARDVYGIAQARIAGIGDRNHSHTPGEQHIGSFVPKPDRHGQFSEMPFWPLTETGQSAIAENLPLASSAHLGGQVQDTSGNYVEIFRFRTVRLAGWPVLVGPVDETGP